MTKARTWVFDFDGTLSRIVTDRKYAVLDSACEEMLVSLSTDPNQTVAVISSRGMEDLIGRIPVHSLLLGAASGLEWRLPDGQRIARYEARLDDLNLRRNALIPVLRELARIPGVEIEDKQWSISVHSRQAARAGREAVADRLDEFLQGGEVTLYRGPEVVEIHLLEGDDKASGIAWVAAQQGWELRPGQMVYCGDDENDLGAMNWVMANEGVAIIVGGRVDLSGALKVANPSSLARAIRNLWHERRVPQRLGEGVA